MNLLGYGCVIGWGEERQRGGAGFQIEGYMMKCQRVLKEHEKEMH